MEYKTNFSRHFIMIEVSARGWKWLSSDGWGFIGTGTVVDVFHSGGTVAVLRDSKNSDSTAQSLTPDGTRAWMPSGPASFPSFYCLSWYCASITVKNGAGFISGSDYVGVHVEAELILFKVPVWNIPRHQEFSTDCDPGITTLAKKIPGSQYCGVWGQWD